MREGVCISRITHDCQTTLLGLCSASCLSPYSVPSTSLTAVVTGMSRTVPASKGQGGGTK